MLYAPEIANVPAPSTGSSTPPKTSTALSTKLIKTSPVSIKVGTWYPFLYQGFITEARPEKIWQNHEGDTFLVVTITVHQKDTWGTNNVTSDMTLAQFKLYLLKGGIDEIVI